MGREALRQKGKAVVAHDALKEVYYEISKEAGRTATKEVVGLYGAYPNQVATRCDEEGREPPCGHAGAGPDHRPQQHD
jgi:hypothetical protein